MPRCKSICTAYDDSHFIEKTFKLNPIFKTKESRMPNFKLDSMSIQPSRNLKVGGGILFYKICIYDIFNQPNIFYEYDVYYNKTYLEDFTMQQSSCSGLISE